MYLSKHAIDRTQQRGIAPMVIDLLLEFGTRELDGKGAEICYFDRRAKKRLESYAGTLLGKISEALDAYAIVAGEKVVTVGIRLKRINHA